MYPTFPTPSSAQKVKDVQPGTSVITTILRCYQGKIPKVGANSNMPKVNKIQSGNNLKYYTAYCCYRIQMRRKEDHAYGLSTT